MTRTNNGDDTIPHSRLPCRFTIIATHHYHYHYQYLLPCHSIILTDDFIKTSAAKTRSKWRCIHLSSFFFFPFMFTYCLHFQTQRGKKVPTFIAGQDMWCTVSKLRCDQSNQSPVRLAYMCLHIFCFRYFGSPICTFPWGCVVVVDVCKGCRRHKSG
jgi:hypothetical protein